MKTRTLNGAWTLEIPGTPFAAVPATVPGSVYHDLLAAERIPNPFYRDNEMEALKLMDNDFVYFRSFQVDDALLAGDKVLLRAEGLDTIAAVHINGQIVGEACNMHRIWEFDVKSVLRPGENTITVSFRSPTKYIKEAYAKSVADGSSDAMVGFPNIRKAHCMFGWDWGPRLPDAGIWRNISIISIEKARIQDVRVDQFHKDGTVRLRIHTNLNRYTDDEVWVNVSVTAPDGSVLTASGTDCELIVQNPQLWWPAGFGGQLGVAAEGAHDAMRFKRMAEEVAGAQLGTAAALDTGRSGAATHEIEGRSRVPVQVVPAGQDNETAGGLGDHFLGEGVGVVHHAALLKARTALVAFTTGCSRE